MRSSDGNAGGRAIGVGAILKNGCRGQSPEAVDCLSRAFMH